MKKILFSSISLMPFISVKPESLIANGCFESGIDGWVMFQDLMRSIDWINYDGCSSLGCIEVCSLNNNGSLAFASSSHAPVRPIESYNLKAQVKPMRHSGATSATIWIEWLNKKGQYEGLNSYYFTIPTNLDNDIWATIDENIIVPVGMFFAVINIAVTGSTGGSNNEALARFDDISLEISSGVF